ncbi:MAG TPA: hypothetical protein DCF63_12255 [Planctomycetaceae bacterium]|nr:hypothetical protein [Planctomycetaceae bacterium]
MGASDKSVSREEVLLLTPGLPIVGLLYGPLLATCTSKSATRRTDHPLYWDVTCEFETSREQQRQDPNNPSDNPTTWIPVFKVDSFISKPRVVTTDKSSPTKPIRNSAKQPFEEPLTVNRLLDPFSFTQFENPTQSLDDIMGRNENVNSSSFLGFGARTLLLNLTGAELGYYGGYPAWRCTYQVTYDNETHDVKLLDVGSCYLDGTDQKPYMDKLNQYRIVGNLNGSGAKAADAATLTFKVYDELDFSTFIRQ